MIEVAANRRLHSLLKEKQEERGSRKTLATFSKDNEWKSIGKEIKDKFQ